MLCQVCYKISVAVCCVCYFAYKHATHRYMAASSCRFPPCAGENCSAPRPQQPEYVFTRVPEWYCAACRTGGVRQCSACMVAKPYGNFARWEREAARLHTKCIECETMPTCSECKKQKPAAMVNLLGRCHECVSQALHTCPRCCQEKPAMDFEKKNRTADHAGTVGYARRRECVRAASCRSQPTRTRHN